MSHSVRHAIKCVVGVACAATLAAGAIAPPAHAAPPPNDRPGQATAIPDVPTVIEADTRTATRDAARRECVLGRSVWYRFRPSAAGPQRISTIGSNYDTLLAVYTGRRSPQTLLKCNDDAAGLQSAVRPTLSAGTRYWIAVSACCGGAAPGGDLVLRLPLGDPEPALDVTVGDVSAGAVSGRLLVSGTATCATPSVVRLRVVASQRVGAGVARGRGRRSFSFCSSDPVDWLVRIDSATGWAFDEGQVALDLAAVGNDGFSRDRVSMEEIKDVNREAAARRAS